PEQQPTTRQNERKFLRNARSAVPSAPEFEERSDGSRGGVGAPALSRAISAESGRSSLGCRLLDLRLRAWDQDRNPSTSHGGGPQAARYRASAFSWLWL